MSAPRSFWKVWALFLHRFVGRRGYDRQTIRNLIAYCERKAAPSERKETA